MIRTTHRIARKAHTCGRLGCKRRINPGELYLYHVASPDHDDLQNSGWWRSKECRDCATVHFFNR